MKIAAALLSLIAAQPVWTDTDGGVLAVDVERAAILVPGPADGGLLPEEDRILHVDGGTYVTAAERIREGQEHADLVGQNAYLREHATDAPALWIGVAATGGAVVGAIVALVAVGVLKH